jgi:CDP-diacylglycerol--glycerol-3-phosphate 3-phosphatidyltransferase
VTPFDVDVSLVLVTGVAAVAAAYGTRVARRGGARFARIEAAGSSPLLGRTAMEMAYWALAPVGRFLVRAGVSANSVTALSLVLGVLAGVALGFGHFGLAALLSVCSALGDALDGFVARESRTASDAGETFDAAVDRYSEFFFLSGLAFHYRASSALLGLVLAALLGSFMVSYATAKAEALRVSPPRGAMRRQERATYLTAGIALSPLAGKLGATFPFQLAADVPVVLALVLVAVVANASAVHRLVRIAELANLRNRERVRSVREPTPIAPSAGAGTEARLRSATR